MARRTIESPLNDGLLEYGKIQTLRDEKTSKKKGEAFRAQGELFFNFVSINAKFDAFQVSSLSAVDIKVKCYFIKDLQKSHKIKIEDELFEIESMDPTRDRRYIFLFLRKVGQWNDRNHFQAT